MVKIASDVYTAVELIGIAPRAECVNGIKCQ